MKTAVIDSHRSYWTTLLFSLWVVVVHTQCDDTESNPIDIEEIKAGVTDDIATVVVVEWKTSEAATGRVEFGEGDDFSHATKMSTTPSTTHRAVLLGMPADADVTYRVVISDGNDEIVSEPQTVTTGKLPVYLPEIEVEGAGPTGYMVVPIISSVNETAVVTIIDEKGRIVWYYQDERDLDIYRARLSRDRQSILYNAASVSGTPSEESAMMRVSLDGESLEAVPVSLLAHDFVEHEDGTIGAIVAEYRDVGDEQIMGNQIVEVTADGAMNTVWSTWDCFDPEADVGDTTDNGWTFANALDYDPVDDAYYIGFLNFSSIAKVDRKSGECLWVFGSTAETISFESEASKFWHQHQFQILEDGILVFDNDGAPGTESRVVEYAFDFDADTASEVWSYTADPSVFTFVLGEPIRLDNGQTLINWSASGQMNLVTEDGESVYQINLPMGNVFGFNTLEQTLY